VEIVAFTGRPSAAAGTGSLPDVFSRFGLPPELAREQAR
jgi:hypothetical protein